MKCKPIILILVLWIAAALLLPAAAEELSPDPAQSQIERIVISYGNSGKRDEAALSVLSSLNPSLGEKWTRIMDLWKAPVRVRKKLPDDLPEDDSLGLIGLGF